MLVWYQRQSLTCKARKVVSMAHPKLQSVGQAPLSETLHEAVSCKCRNVMKELSFHLYSIWLFTFTDLKTTVLPSTAFALFNGSAVSYHMANIQSSNYNLPSPYQVLKSTPMVLFWVWINLLPFTISNQRSPDAIEEDKLNKPWRTMPSQRLGRGSAKYLMLAFYLIAIIASLQFGNLAQCLALILLGYWYNDLGGADVSCLSRNFINGCGFTCFSSGAMQVAISGPMFQGRRSESALKLLGWWYFVIACIVFTTVETQDMYDQRGDGIRNRKTLPLVIGDAPARWAIAVFMGFWCLSTPWLWSSSIYGYIAPILLGLTVSLRTLVARSEEEDKITFRIWNLWLVSIYLLPFFKASETCLLGETKCF